MATEEKKTQQPQQKLDINIEMALLQKQLAGRPHVLLAAWANDDGSVDFYRNATGSEENLDFLVQYLERKLVQIYGMVEISRIEKQKKAAAQPPTPPPNGAEPPAPPELPPAAPAEPAQPPAPAATPPAGGEKLN